MSRLREREAGAGLPAFARIHRLGPVLAAAAAVAVVAAVLGGYRIPLPSLGSGVSRGIPFRQELPLLSAVFLAAALGSRMEEFEEAAGPRYFRVRTLALTGAVGTVCLMSFALVAWAAGGPEGTAFVRSLLLWFGLALLSARLFGGHLAWLLPLVSAFPPIWWNDGAPWDWTRAGPGDPLAWGLAGIGLCAGVLATVATRRRLAGLRRARRSTAA